jgi:hypothetical protein
MAIDDLIDSLERLIDFLNKSHEFAFARDLDKQYRRILEAVQMNDRTGIKESIEKIKSFFGGMGSLNDIAICRANRNVPSGLAMIGANTRLDKMLDDLFMWCCLWNVESTRAKKIYEKYIEDHPSDLPLRMSRTFKGF